ncbi:putative Swi5 [Monocercomonoides exilis]|uniref:putative Swi5 n=1 Tax=Monocercomonoides exilis TaxID=2049356 RepID=UPI00355AA7A0|nr:putative Swi5 [Monocercomonoides exilis]|eukprot:MONOS_13301.1-p1 / transcript=MONOS_13301.1 / gene=MONOS_13301 / organism=Monocercomonoides_exilis_PA203 / gene_product=unspecified product / transcript_product=unspecified product / location=Mono_scaffold00805:23934-24546(+) / protein_length=148 / sequence_SO=supercontig / SO=protein_coding / is_pseudo=false
MDLVEKCSGVILEGKRPYSFDELIEQFSITEDQEKVYDLLKQREDIAHHVYQIEHESVTLFWRNDLRKEHAKQHLTCWIKKSNSILSNHLSKKSATDSSLPKSQEVIDALHRYNDLKDAAQLLLGKYAEVEGMTVKQMYEKFGISIDD